MENKLEHLGIIPDGNRRFAKKLMKKPWKGHEWGAEKVKKVVEWANQFGVKIATIYALSWENLKRRPEKEFNYLMKIFREQSLEMAEADKTHENQVKYNVVGNYHKLPDEVVEALEKLQDVTEDYNGFVANLAVAYSGKKELLNAFKSIKDSEDKITEETIKDNLWVNGKDPDLIIRTGGEKRLSNFLLWQAAYSELYFIDKMWPEVEKEDIEEAINEFDSRKRKFGE